MDTIAQQETKAILQLKKDYDAAIKDRDLWKAEAERWREISMRQTVVANDNSVFPAFSILR